MKYALLLVVISGLLLAIILLPLPIPARADFQVLFSADVGLLHGISVYDQAGQARVMAEVLGRPEGSVHVLPFPYPPWYALVTFPLAFFKAEAAARIWFLANLGMVLATVWFLTDGWPPRKRLAGYGIAFLFLPILGSVTVGQYGIPTLLGAAILGYALAHEKAKLAAASLALLTFKPHIGTLILIAGLIYLLAQRDNFGRRTLRFTLFAGLFLFLVGFGGSPLWPVYYVRSLISFKGVSECGLCNSIAMDVSALLHGGFNLAILIALVLLVLFVALMVWQRHVLAQEPRLLIAAAGLTTLLASPYLQNYDYILLLLPLFALAARAQRLDWVWLAVAYLLPFLGLGMAGIQFESSLIISTVIVLILFARTIYSARSLPPAAAGDRQAVGAASA